MYVRIIHCMCCVLIIIIIVCLRNMSISTLHKGDYDDDGNNNNNNNNNNNLLQLGCYPVAVVILHVYKI